MHATEEQLIALADGDPVPDALPAHLRDCADCRRAAAQIEAWRTALRELPALQPPAHVWPAVQRRRDRPRAWSSPRLAGLAAVLLLAVLGGIVWRHVPVRPADLVVEERATTLAEGELQRLQARSVYLEQALGALPQRQVMRLSTAGTIAQLEDRLALVDYRLSVATGGGEPMANEDERRLWRARVELMNSLWEVRYAETAF